MSPINGFGSYAPPPEPELLDPGFSSDDSDESPAPSMSTLPSFTPSDSAPFPPFKRSSRALEDSVSVRTRKYCGWTTEQDAKLKELISELEDPDKSDQIAFERWDELVERFNGQLQPGDTPKTREQCRTRVRYCERRLHPTNGKVRYCWQRSQLEQLIKLAFESAFATGVKPWEKIFPRISKPDLDSNKCKCEFDTLIKKYSRDYFPYFREFFGIMGITGNDKRNDACIKKARFVRLAGGYESKFHELFNRIPEYPCSILMLQWEIFMNLWKKNPARNFEDMLSIYKSRFNLNEETEIPPKNGFAEIEPEETELDKLKPSDLVNPSLMYREEVPTFRQTDGLGEDLFELPPGSPEDVKADRVAAAVLFPKTIAGVRSGAKAALRLASIPEAREEAEMVVNQPIDYGNDGLEEDGPEFMQNRRKKRRR